MKNERIPLRQALFYIVMTLFAVSGTSAAVLLYLQHARTVRERDPHFRVAAIVQRSQWVEVLPTAYLAELMHLSVDRPANIFKLSTRELERKLRGSPLIKAVEVTKVIPGTILVDYELRVPIAFLGDFTNTALDSEGFLMPFKPYFTPKKLPTIYLGLNDEELVWGKAVQSTRARLALDVYHLMITHCCQEKVQLVRVDVSKAEGLSDGQRSLVVIMEDRIEHGEALVVQQRMLRLSPDNYRQELANYLVLREHLNRQVSVEGQGIVQAPVMTVDLRIPHLAYISYN